jgi:hypothetical protein
MSFADLISKALNQLGNVDPTVFALFCIVVSVVLWVLGRTPPRDTTQIILVDGSNVMFWRDNVPDMTTLKAAIAHLTDQGYSPGLVFDANVGYKLEGRFRGHLPLARKLGLKPEQVVVVGKGDPADRLILTVARALNARILSNDRFRDWRDAFPEVAEPGRVIRGGVRDGEFWTELA